MGKINDLKAYWKEQAVKAGLDAETLKQAEPLLDNPAYLKALTDGFKPLPDYSADLDATRDRAAKDTEAKYKAWFDQEQLKYQQYTKVLDDYAKYVEIHGPLDSGGGGGANGGGGGGGNNGGGAGSDRGNVLTREEVDRLLQQRDANALDYMEIRERHLSDFKKPLDRKSFEGYWKEHPEYASMSAAYDSFVRPEVDKAKDATYQDQLKSKYEEGLRDGASRRNLPTSTGSREFSPLLDQNQDVLKLDERGQDQHSRKSFFEAFHNPEGDVKK